MAKRNSGNQDFTWNADGWDMSGGTTPRILTVTGGNVTLTGGGTTTYTFPQTASFSRLVGSDGNDIAWTRNITGNYQSITSSATTFTLTSASPQVTEFTGSTAQTCVLPNATTLFLGLVYEIVNSTTVNLTVQVNGGTTLVVVPSYTSVHLTCVSIAAAAGTWDVIMTSDGSLASSGNIGTASYVPAVQYIMQNADRTAFSTGTTGVAIFNTSTNGRVAVEANTLYKFECFISASGFSATAGSFSFGLVPTAGTYTRLNFVSQAFKNTTTAIDTGTTNTTMQVRYHQSTNGAVAAVVTPTSNTGTVGRAFIQGTFLTGATATTIQPQIATSVASTTTVINAGSYFMLTKIGSTSNTFIGNWT